MTKKRRAFENVGANNTPSQEDEADIVAEAGAEQDENGELVVDEETVLRLGAVDAESVRENRRLQKVADKKKGNVPNVAFNTKDPVVIYDTILKSWGSDSVSIGIKRLTGSPVQDVITSLPRSGTDLLAAIKAFHAQNDGHLEATYEVKFRDSGNQEYRGTGRITLPGTRSQQGQPMNAPYPPGPYYPPQPGYPPAAAPSYNPQYPQQGAPPQPPPAAPQQPPSVHVMPQPGPDPMAMMQQMFGMFKQMQESFAAQSQPQPQPQSQPQPQMPPPPQSTDPGAMIGWMQQMFQMFQQMQAQQQPTRSREPAQPQQPQMNPMMAAMGMMPPVQTPPGMIWLPPFGFVRTDSLMQALGGSAPTQSPSGPGPGMYRPSSAHRPPYTPGYGGPPQGQPPPQRQMTPAEQLRDALTVVRTVASAVEELREFGIGEVSEAPASRPSAADEDSPVQVIDTGPAKIVVDRKSGTLRPWETGWANADKILKWASEQREAYQRAQIEHQRGQQPVRQLPPDHIEVPVGQPPPPGYYPVDPQQASSPLPPPPAHMPPPIQSTPAPRRTWGMPTVPDPEGENY